MCAARCSSSDLDPADIRAVTTAHPRPDFKRQILAAFTHGFADRPETTFGTVNADVLAHFLPGFTRTDFVEVIETNPGPNDPPLELARQPRRNAATAGLRVIRAKVSAVPRRTGRTSSGTAFGSHP